MTKNKQFYRMMLSIAIPVALQNMITSCLNMIDTVMISSLGSASIAGVGLANQIFFFYILICFGINTGSSVLVSQYWGRRDVDSVRKVNGLATLLCLITGLIFTLMAFFFPRLMMRLLTADNDVIMEGAKYLKIVSFSYILTSISGTYGTSLRSTGQANMPLLASIVGFLINTFFNYVLIFGALRFPQLGIMGAALGTVIARLIEFLIIVPYSHFYDGPIRATFKQMASMDKNFVSQALVILAPVIINEAFWSLGQVVYNIAYAMTGTDSTAAVQVASSIQNILFVIVRGLSSSCTIMVGQKIGEGKINEVYDIANKFIKLTVISGIIMGLLINFSTEILLLAYQNLTSNVAALAQQLLKIMGVFYVVKAFNSVIVVGILRGGGDTKFSMFMETACVWLVGVPLSLIAVKWLNLPVYWVMCVVMLDEVFKAFIGTWRFKSRRWINEIGLKDSGFGDLA